MKRQPKEQGQEVWGQEINIQNIQGTLNSTIEKQIIQFTMYKNCDRQFFRGGFGLFWFGGLEFLLFLCFFVSKQKLTV